MHFHIIVALVIPCFWYVIYWDWLYYLFSSIMYFHEVIQIYHFCVLLVLFYFYSSTHIRYCFWNMWFLLIYSNFISLRRHHFLPVISIAHTTLRTMLSLVGGDSWGRKFFIVNTKYFGNLGYFCLILKFFSMVIKEKFAN